MEIITVLALLVFVYLSRSEEDCWSDIQNDINPLQILHCTLL